MSSRRNKSNKVPNVKLRPVLPTSSASSSTSRHDSNSKYGGIMRKDSGFDSEGDADMSTTFSMDVCPRPFRGVLLCATGISDKTSLFKQAIELGAQSLSDLTDRVTHVIAEVPGSAKYKCALENGIPIMHPSWIYENYKVWLKGDDVDFQESTAKHRLPIFSNVVVSLSGISSIERRMEINRMVTHNGGSHVKNLERPVKVTHLVCSREATIFEDQEDDAGGAKMGEPWVTDKSEKMIYAQKFNERGEAHIHIVWEEWLWDCFAYGGRFDEEEYLVTKPRPQRKPDPKTTILNRTSMPIDQSIEPSSSNPQPNEVAHNPSLNEEDEELASVKRIPDVKLRIWETIMGSRGFEVAGGKLVRSPSKSGAVRESAPPPPIAMENDGRAQSPPHILKKREDVNGKKPAAGGSFLASFRRSKSFAPASKDVSTQKQPFQRVATVGASSSEDAFWGISGDAVGGILAQGGDDVPVASGSRTPTSAVAMGRESSFMVASSSRPRPRGASEKIGIFMGLTFRALGEARCASVKTAVEEAGGRLVDDQDADVDYVVVRLVSGSKLFREEPDDSLRSRYRTECWLERCLFEERICGPEEHVVFVPLAVETPVAGAEEVSLSFSGLDQSEGLWVRRLARALGLTLAPNFSRRTTHLLCPSMEGAKFTKANEWNIPVVDMSWVAQMAREGIVPPIILEGADPNDPDVLPVLNMAAVAMEDVRQTDVKGKGKQKATELAVADITNNDPPPIIDDPPDKHIPDPDIDPPVPHEDSGQHSEALFGKPGVLLSHPPPSSPPIPPGGPATSPLQSRASTVEPHSTPVRQDIGGGIGREPTLQELRQDMMSARIPSSESPSPMKPPSAGTAGKGRAFGHSSPKISREASKVLQESITSLLGKRQPSEEDVGANGGRGGKRSRPLLRTKSRSDQPPTPHAVAPPSAIPPHPFDPYALEGEEDISMLAAEGPNTEDQSMRIIYEDPNQQDERKRLMRLLDSQKKEFWDVDDPNQLPQLVAKPGQSAGSSKKGKGTRRSARVAGF